MDYNTNYKTSPTKEVLVEEVTEMCGKTKKKSQMLDDYLHNIEIMSNMDFYDIEYIKDKIKDFGKRQALVDAIMESASILEKEPNTQYPKIELLVKEALMVGEGVADLGIDFWDGYRERLLDYVTDNDVIERIPTGIKKLDECLNGGLGRTEMGVIVAPPGRGKTTHLISIGAGAMESGYKVLHVSFENNEKQITRNYTNRLIRRDREYISDNFDRSEGSLFNIRKYKKGDLRIKKYSTKGATVKDIEMLINKLSLVENYKVDVLIVDYGAIVKPTSHYNDKRNNIEEVYEDLRALADEYDLALWTAAQGNRGALSKKVVTMSDLAECFAISNIADVMACVCQTLAEKKAGESRLYLPKIRDNADNMIMKGTVDFSTKVVTMDEIADVEDDEASDEESDDWEK